LLPRPLTELAARQHGLTSHAQAVAAGLTDQHLFRRVRAGDLVRLDTGVYLLPGAPPSWVRDVMAAVLSIPGALASHRTAAALWELDGFPPAHIEVVAEQGGWRRRDITVHQTRDLVAADISERAGIPCTSLVRTLVDLPAVTWEHRCGQALDGAARKDRSVLELVRHRHLEVARRGRNGTVVLRSLLERRGATDRLVDSGFERKALALVEDAQLPAPVPQLQVRDGRFVAHIDLAWPDRMVGMECDSLLHHFGERAHQWDRTRRRHLTLLGWTMLEFTYQDVVERGPTVVRQLRQALFPPS
jgi:very-short-patch-repair endonuclease